MIVSSWTTQQLTGVVAHPTTTALCVGKLGGLSENLGDSSLDSDARKQIGSGEWLTDHNSHPLALKQRQRSNLEPNLSRMMRILSLRRVSEYQK